MTDFQIGVIALVVLMVLIVMGMRIAYAVTIVGAIGIIAVRGWGPGTALLGTIPSSVVGTYSYSAIPLFILMGYLTYYSGIADDLFDTSRVWVQHLHGGLPIATILASAGFATVSGSSSAATSVLGKMAIPRMLDAGVDRKLAAGTVAMGGCIAALIPPSTIMIIYGIITEQSIGAMLIAGIIPGILTVVLYIIMIYVRTRLNPSLAPITKKASWMERFKSLKNIYGVIILFVLIMGGMYFGVFTPTEAAGIGAGGALLLGLALRRLNFEKIRISAMEAIKTSTMIFAIMVGISMLIRFLAQTGLTQYISTFITDLPVPPIGILIIMLTIYLILGMFMDAVSMMMITLPIFFPIIQSLGLHPIWFGILVVKMAEIGLVSPPVGLNCFIVKSVAPKIPLGDVFWGVLPFIFIEFIIITILILFPPLVTFLPELMR